MAEQIQISWAHDERRLARSRNYWLATVRTDGRPHVAPVWGVWLDRVFHFATARTTAKGRSLVANPRASLHLDDSEDVLIVEGNVAPAEDVALHDRIDVALAAKYVTIRSGLPYRSEMNPEARLWTFTPVRAFAWWELAMNETSRLWQWDGDAEPSRASHWHPFGR